MAGVYRWRVYSGPPSPREYGVDPPKSSPTAGGNVETTNGSRLARNHVAPGQVWRIRCGGSFGSGADLATDGFGRAVAAGSGDVVVARALEGSSGAGDTAWVVMVSQT